MLDNMIKSVYGTLLLIIQAFSSEEHNIYTLMGRARRNRRSNNRNKNQNEINRSENRIEPTGNRSDNRTKPIDDCFALYILFKKLHMLFVYQAYSILYNERFI